MKNALVVSLLLFLGYGPVSFAQQDGKAQVHREYLLPSEELAMHEAERPDRRVAPQHMAVWTRYVRPDKRKQFESILTLFEQIGNRALKEGRMTPRQERAYRSLRILPPSTVGNGEDARYRFVAIPYEENGDYSIRSVLELGTSPDEAAAIYENFQEALARPDTHVAVVRMP